MRDASTGSRPRQCLRRVRQRADSEVASLAGEHDAFAEELGFFGGEVEAAVELTRESRWWRDGHVPPIGLRVVQDSVPLQRCPVEARRKRADGLTCDLADHPVDGRRRSHHLDEFAFLGVGSGEDRRAAGLGRRSLKDPRDDQEVAGPGVDGRRTGEHQIAQAVSDLPDTEVVERSSVAEQTNNLTHPAFVRG